MIDVHDNIPCTNYISDQLHAIHITGHKFHRHPGRRLEPSKALHATITQHMELRHESWSCIHLKAPPPPPP
jgi:hypothetical protein